MSIELIIEKPLILSKSDVRPSHAAFRKAMDNRLRPRFHRMAEDASNNMWYDRLARHFKVTSSSTTDTVTFTLRNTHEASIYLLQRGGTPSHTIEQGPHTVPRHKLLAWATGFTDVNEEWLAGFAQARIKRRGVIIEHPGTHEDTGFWRTIDSWRPQLMEAAANGGAYWMSKWGMEG